MAVAVHRHPATAVVDQRHVMAAADQHRVTAAVEQHRHSVAAVATAAATEDVTPLVAPRKVAVFSVAVPTHGVRQKCCCGSPNHAIFRR